MNERKILFIATAFSPENAVGSIRTTKIVKYLARNDFKVTVISPKLFGNTKLDYSLECEELKRVERVTISHSRLFKTLFLRKRNKMLKNKSASNYFNIKNKKSVFSYLKSQFYISIHFIYTYLRNKDWSRKVKLYISKHIAINDYSGVISSYPSLSTHWVSYSLSEKYGLFWIADFRDPINYEANSNKLINNFNKYFQNKIIKQANYTITISEDLIAKLNLNNKHDNNKLICIPNGFDPDDYKDVTNLQKENITKKLKMCYVGSLYGGKRDLSIIFKTMRNLIDEEIIEEENLIFNYAGNEFDVLNEQAKRFNLSSILVNKGFITREESIKMQSDSDLIIIVTWNTEIDKGIMTGKFYECLLTNKMILGVVNGTVPNSEIKRVVNDIKGGFVYEEAALDLLKESESLKNFILEKYLEKQTNYKIFSTFNSKIENYNYSNLTNSFIDLLNKNSFN